MSAGKAQFLPGRGEIGRKYKESGIPPPAGTKKGVWGGEARRRQIEMRMVPAPNTDGLILYGPALFLSFYLLDMGSG